MSNTNNTMTVSHALGLLLAAVAIEHLSRYLSPKEEEIKSPEYNESNLKEWNKYEDGDVRQDEPKITSNSSSDSIDTEVHGNVGTAPSNIDFDDDEDEKQDNPSTNKPNKPNKP